MKSATGRWVNGEDFFGRSKELEVLKGMVLDRNHVLLGGQRRMGKTSMLRELCRLLEEDGWIFLFADVEGATCPEDAIVEIGQSTQQFRPRISRFGAGISQWFGQRFEDLEAASFRFKFRAKLNSGSWRRYGDRLLRECAGKGKPFLVVIDELPIFLNRMLRNDGNVERVDEFLSWLRATAQKPGGQAPVFILSGSIGLEPMVSRVGLYDRINYLRPYRLGPWDKRESIECVELLAINYNLRMEEGVAETVYKLLGIGIPHHVQSFFARLREFSLMQDRQTVCVEDVNHVYRNELLGASGQNDLIHYESRLKEALDDDSHSIAMEILAETATTGLFGPGARKCLIDLYSKVTDAAADRVSATLDVLVHDGYLKEAREGYFFNSHLLADWWKARFRGHHIPLEKR